LNISETVRDIETWFQRTTNRKWPMRNRMVIWPMTSRDLEGLSLDPNTLGAQYLENSWRCYLATVAKVCCMAVRPAILHVATACL